jgi:hypothetical protein
MKKPFLLALAFVLAAGASAPLAADEASEKAAEKSAAAWLSLVDSGKYAESWTGAAEAFHQALSQAQWKAALEQVRTPLGTVVSRKLRSAKYTRELPGAPAGDYVVIQYATDFEKKSGATETVTPAKDKDGVWRVSGYYIK